MHAFLTLALDGGVQSWMLGGPQSQPGHMNLIKTWTSEWC